MLVDVDNHALQHTDNTRMQLCNLIKLQDVYNIFTFTYMFNVFHSGRPALDPKCVVDLEKIEGTSFFTIETPTTCTVLYITKTFYILRSKFSARVFSLIILFLRILFSSTLHLLLQIQSNIQQKQNKLLNTCFFYNSPNSSC